MKEKTTFTSKSFLVLIRAISILGLVWLVYWPALHGTWLWDDGYEVANNPMLADPHALPKIWRGEGAGIAALVLVFAGLGWSHAGNFAARPRFGLTRLNSPDLAVVYNNLGIELVRLHKVAAARAHFEVALRLDPHMRAARENLHALETELAGLVE